MKIENGTVLFGKYKVVKVLGKGGFSTVYLAENVRVGNLVAIKVIDDSDNDTNLMAEKDMLKELRHPAIPVIIDIEMVQGELYLVEEYVEGVSLKELKLQLNEEEVIGIMRQLIDVLMYLHTSFSEPIIYRDLKPDNIIRMHNGHIKLIDFGIAKRYKKYQDRDTVQLGSRGYAPPEQYGVGKVDERSDIFSLGVCIYYLLTGKNLSTPPYKLRPIRAENEGVSLELEKIIGRCIEAIPSKRYSSVASLRMDLERIDKKDSDGKDLEAFCDHSSLVINVSGIKSGIGTTHMALLNAFYHKAKGKSVALVEYHFTEDFTKILFANDVVDEQRFRFQWMGIDFYPYYQQGGYRKILNDDYDVIILDSGVDQGNYMTHEKGHIESILVCGGKDWELDAFEDYYFGDPDRNRNYCFNLIEESRYMSIISSISNLKCYFVPYNPNPYELGKDMVALFDKIECDKRAEPEKLEGGFHEVGRFIKEALKKYKNA